MWFAVILLSILITATSRADLHDPNNSADYLILTSEDVLSDHSWLDSLLDYRAAQGRTVMAVTVEEIWAEFAPAGSDTAIREFLHFAYENWQQPRLKDVFIVGHTDIVPSTVLTPTYDSTSYSSDYLYAVPLETDSYSPRFAVGRLPWSPRFDVPLENFLTKVRAFEMSVPGAWSNRCLLIADTSCATLSCMELMESSVGEAVPTGVQAERDYFELQGGDPWHGDRDEALEHLNEGSLFTCYMGSGNSTEILPNGAIDASDFASLTNLSQLTLFCGTVPYALGTDTLTSEPLHLAALQSTTGGFVASIAHSAIGWVISGSIYHRDMMNELFAPQNESVGDVWMTACDGYADQYLTGEFNSNSSWVMLLGNALLGDPATIIPGRSTSAEPISMPVVPSDVRIVGNHPNPFNPSTTINFVLNRAGAATLIVYDVTGRTVGTLVNENLTAGPHSVTWSPTGLASGLYLMRLESAGQFATHRVTLLK